MLTGGDIRTLDALPPGRAGKVIKVEGGRGLVMRLYQMGFVPGAFVKVIVNRGVGPLIVDIMGAEIAIGRGIARRIVVELAEGERVEGDQGSASGPA